MLVSHRCRYVFIKTMKTAGTSVEVYFEPYCLPEGMASGAEFRAASVSDAGIVGFRGFPRPWPFRPRWYGHMPARQIRRLVGQRVWDEYFKFTIVRNPFDKLVSAFFYVASSRNASPRPSWRWTGAWPTIVPTLGRNDAETVGNFRSWVRRGRLPYDRHLYFIGSRESIDFFIRYEDLRSGIEAVCARVGIAYEPHRLPVFKSQFRNHRMKVGDFYDRKTEAIVRERFAWEIDKFAYDLA